MWWTLAAATVASLTAIFISIAVYPWQKSIDRSADLLKEKRQLVGQLLAIFANTEKLFGEDPSAVTELRILVYQGSSIFSTPLYDEVLKYYHLVESLNEEVDLARKKDVEFETPDVWLKDFGKSGESLAGLTRRECFSTDDLHPTLGKWINNMIRGNKK